MLDVTRLAREYVASMSKADFLVDRLTQQAAVLNLITIGEIATRLMSEHPDFVANHPDIPWRQMRGMKRRRMTPVRETGAHDGSRAIDSAFEMSY